MSQQNQPLLILRAQVESLLENRIQTRTLQKYKGVVRRYAEFCRAHDLTALPPTEDTLTLWIVHLTNTCTADSIANYLAAVGDYCRINGLDYDTPRMSFRVTSLLQAIRIRYPKTSTYKALISIPHLHQLYASTNHTTIEGTTFFAMSTCAFFGLFRLGELTAHEDPRRTLKRSSITNETERGLFIRLLASKTDLTWQGSNIFIPKWTSDICPVRALKNMLRLRTDNMDTLFVMKDGATFTRTRFLTLLAIHLPNIPHISGHSFRAGGATWAANLGLSELDICRMGRWSSQAFRRYIRNHPLLQYLFTNHPLNQQRAIRPQQ